MLDSIKIIRKDVKNINLRVKPSGEVILTTRQDTSDEFIRFILQKRAMWILKQKEFFTSHKKQEKEFVSGEDFKYLGKSYRLKAFESKDEFAKLNGGYLELYVKDKNDIKRKKNLLEKWYRKKAELYFSKILKEFAYITKQEPKVLKIRQMKTRWGSCNAHKGYINLNLELIKKPKICIEYVIFHELVHLLYPQHSKSFYHYLTCYMNDWKQRKERLERA